MLTGTAIGGVPLTGVTGTGVTTMFLDTADPTPLVDEVANPGTVEIIPAEAQQVEVMPDIPQPIEVMDMLDLSPPTQVPVKSSLATRFAGTASTLLAAGCSPETTSNLGFTATLPDTIGAAMALVGVFGIKYSVFVAPSKKVVLTDTLALAAGSGIAFLNATGGTENPNLPWAVTLGLASQVVLYVTNILHGLNLGGHSVDKAGRYRSPVEDIIRNTASKAKNKNPAADVEPYQDE